MERSQIRELDELIEKQPFCLAITVDSTLDREVIRDGTFTPTQRHNNPDIGKFQNCVRSWEQDKRIPVCAYSEKVTAIPTEIGINLGFIGTSRKRQQELGKS